MVWLKEGTILHASVVTLVFVLTLVLVGPFLVLFMIYCYLKKTAVNWFYNWEGRLDFVSSRDSMWIDSRGRRNFNQVTICCFMDGMIDPEELRQRMQKLLDMENDYGQLYAAKLMKHTVNVAGFYFWEPDSNFRLEDHISFHEEPVLLDDDEVKDVATKLNNLQLPRDKSPWRIDVFKMANNKHVFILRFEHTIGDGLVLVVALNRMFSSDAVDLEMWLKLLLTRYTPSTWKWMAIVLKSLFLMPYLTVKYLYLLKFHDVSPFAYNDKLDRQSLCTWSREIDFELIKKMKVAAKSSMHEVMVACLARAMKRMFQREGMTMPFREIVAGQAAVIGNPNDFHNRMENSFGVSRLCIPMRSHSTVGCLNRLRKETHSAEFFAYMLVTYLTAPIMWNFLPISVTEAIMDNFDFSMLLSNIVVTPKKIQGFGTSINRIVAGGPYFGKTGALCLILTYAGKVTFSFSVNRALIRDREVLERFMEDLYEEFHDFAKDLGVL